MSVTLFVLNTKEFEQVSAAAEAAGMTSQPWGDYTRWTADSDEVVLRRAGEHPRDALWFAALTGGCDGRIIAFDDATLSLRVERDGMRA